MAKKPPAKPKPPAYDSIYQNALNNFKRLTTSANNAWTAQGNQNLLNRNQAYKPLDTEAPIRRDAIRDDAAGRGMLFSTTYAEDLTKYNDDLANRRNAVTRGYDEATSNNDRQRQQLLDSITMQKAQARLDWLARRAASRLKGS